MTGAVPTSVEIFPATTTAPVGTEGQLRLFANYSDNSRAEVTSEATWVSNDTAVVVVEASGQKAGYAQIVGIGSTTVTATFEGLVAQADVSGTAAELVSLVVTPDDAVVAAGIEAAYTATGTYTDGDDRRGVLGEQ